MPNDQPSVPLPDRRSIRLKGFDYTRAGAYFITLCTQDRLCLFGHVADDRVHLTPIGTIVRECWDDLPAHHARLQLDAFQIMPNHAHGILWLTFDPAHPSADAESKPGPGHRPAGPAAGSVAAVIGSFKSAVSRKVNLARGRSGASDWQRDYFEHVIRDERSLALIREYVVTNPRRWASDKENPRGDGTDDVEVWVKSLAEEATAASAGAKPALLTPSGAGGLRTTQASPLRGGEGSADAPPDVPGVRATQASPLRAEIAAIEPSGAGGVRATQASPLRAEIAAVAPSGAGGVRATQASPLRAKNCAVAPPDTAGVRATQASPLRAENPAVAPSGAPGVRATRASPLRVGHGYDLHRLQPGGTLVLGGLAVAEGLSPVAHSDGDVVLHALVDALLGAMGWGDIGDHFPNNDPQWKDAPSHVFVSAVYDKVRAAGYVVQNLDVTVLAERPKLKAFKKPMAEHVAGLLHVAPEQVNVKAGTNEGCDAIGRGEAIAAHAVLLLAGA